MNNQKLNVQYVRHGIANRFPDGVVELHYALHKYPELRKALIMHELRHTDNNHFNKKDLLHDLTTPDQVSQFQLAKFMFRHPSSFTQFLPAYYSKKRGLVIDQNLIFIYSIILIIIGIAWII